MGIIDNVLKARGYINVEKLAKQKGLESLGEAWGGTGTVPGYSTKLSNQKEQLMAYRDWVYAAARAIAEGIATIDYELYVNRTSTKNAIIGQRIANHPSKAQELMKRRGEVVLRDGTKALKPMLEEIDNHPLLDLLYRPNPFMTKDEFTELTTLHMELAGEAFWLVLRDRVGKPVELWPLVPYLVQVVPDPLLFIKGYVYSTPSGKQMPLEPDDVIHHKYMNPMNPYRGMSVVQAAARAVDTDAHSADYNRNFFYNAAIPAIALSTDGTLSDKVYGRLKDEWDGRYGGTQNAHKTAILEEGLKVSVMSMAQKDMEFLESRKFNRDQILALFRVSGSILGITENVNRANAEAAEFTFAKHVLKPKMMRLVNRLTEDLAIQFDSKLVLGFCDPVPDDKDFTLREKQASVNEWKTVNEIRAQENDEPIEGGDVLYQPSGLLPLGAVPEEPVANTDAQDQVTEALKDMARTQAVMMKQLAELESKKKGIYRDFDEREAIGAEVADKVDKLSLGYEAKLLKTTRTLSEQQKAEVLRSLKKQVKLAPTSAKKLDDLFSMDQWLKKFVMAYKPIYKQNIKDAADEALLLVSAHGFDISDPKVVKFYENRPKAISKDFLGETDKQLKATLSEGIDQGESIADLSDRVEKVYGSQIGYRAERLARTETIKINGFATEEAWTQSNVVEGKEWFTAMDERVCPFCGDMDGKTVGLEDNFWNKGDSFSVTDKGGNEQTINLDYEDVGTPPLHASCRCVLLPILKDN